MYKNFLWLFLCISLLASLPVHARNVDDFGPVLIKRAKIAKKPEPQKDRSDKEKETVWQWSGKVFASGRGFPRGSSTLVGGSKKDFNFAITLAPELKVQRGKFSLKLAPYLRHDFEDGERSDFDLRQAYVAFSGEKTDIKAGFEVENWSVLEFGHIVNIVNQFDTRESLFLDHYLGQLMLSLQRHENFGSFQLIVMPSFRPMFFFPPSSRLSFGVKVADFDSDPLVGAGSDSGVDTLLRYSHSFGSVDLGVYGFYGTSRQPNLSVGFDTQALRLQLTPSYETVVQLGLDLQSSLAGFLQKLEATYMLTDAQNLLNIAGGVEYSFSAIFGSSLDLGLFSEFYFSNVDAGRSEAFVLLQNDLYGGVRLSYAGQTALSLVLAASHDLEHQSDALAVKGEYKFVDHWGLGLEAWAMTRVREKDALLYALRHDRFLRISAEYYF